MSFFNRFLIFFFGILFGCLILNLSFNFRGEPIRFNYLPNNRIKSNIIHGDVFFSSQALCKISCFNLDTLLLDDYLLDSNVDFKKSKIRGFSPKTYYLLWNEAQNIISQTIYFKFQILTDTISLVDIVVNPDSSLNDTSNNYNLLSCPNCY